MKSIDELLIYKIALELAEEVWQTIEKWNYFERDTLGKQLIRAVDSIASNIAEGYGRFHFQENKHFCYYARGSLIETKCWLIKAFRRNLLDQKTYDFFIITLDDLHIKLNAYIKSIGKNS